LRRRVIPAFADTETYASLNKCDYRKRPQSCSPNLSDHLTLKKRKSDFCSIFRIIKAYLANLRTTWLGGRLVYKVKTKRKRSKPLVILMLPALIFIGFLGWLMYAMGNRKPANKQTHKAPVKTPNAPKRDDGVSFVPVDLEEQKVISK